FKSVPMRCFVAMSKLLTIWRPLKMLSLSLRWRRSWPGLSGSLIGARFSLNLCLSLVEVLQESLGI
ncbi:hypothetical protein ACHAO7_012323, partial [Fusarium culmorum]